MIESEIDALRHLYDAGAFLRLAKPDKSLSGVMEGIEFETGPDGGLVFDTLPNGVRKARGQWKTRARSSWREIEAHVKAGGKVLIYAPGASLGVMVLDFDPLLEERVDSISAILGAPPYRQFKSSGKWKPAEGSRPAGYGGHACWRIDSGAAEEAGRIRRFSAVPDGDHYGEAFTGHPGFGVIAWNPQAIVETMELDPAEAVDPLRLPVARYSLAARDPATGEWVAGEGSRHDSAWSEISRAAFLKKTKKEFTDALSEIEKRFKESFADPIELEKRLRGGEWDRMEKKGWDRWASDRHQEAEARQAGTLQHARLMSLLRTRSK